MLHNFKRIRDRVEALPLDSVKCEHFHIHRRGEETWLICSR
jgi:hypothetical protein